MIKYFDFENEIEKLDILIKNLNGDIKNAKKIEYYNLEKKKII